MDFPRECGSAQEMEALGRELAVDLAPGEVVALSGPLGAGKTQLVKGVALGLGYEGEVTSPTFTLLHEYRGGRRDLLHLDFYRIEDAAEVEALGWDELREDGAVVVVEWGEKFPGLLPAKSRRLEIEILPGGQRRVHERPG
ncbi:MAG: tRNA (adenosine(37)-N6)-threonylcarbamoyltransferase complex ATPase subunit type 1 TsaE [Akkermansiaceae bacterium]|nr:tRNA (adenosine(37)-N6)-threonylcarbamoyltransferase complex ATPase subunit type 1 TsaE [Akkermansiaceae bacterium]